MSWTDEKNDRRCDLIDVKIDGKLLPNEKLELEILQEEMYAYRRKMAPLPTVPLQRGVDNEQQ